MNWALPRALVLVALLGTLTPACDNGSPTEPTSTTPTFVTETFSGALSPGAAATHLFSVSTQGGVVILLLRLEVPNAEQPEGETPPPPPLGLAIGTWNGSACSRVARNDNATPGTTLTGTALPGSFCVEVYDTGALSTEVNYTFSVDHP